MKCRLPEKVAEVTRLFIMTIARVVINEVKGRRVDIQAQGPDQDPDPPDRVIEELLKRHTAKGVHHLTPESVITRKSIVVINCNYNINIFKLELKDEMDILILTAFRFLL